MEITQLTQYQYGVLCQTAEGAAPIFAAARPLRGDSPCKQYELRQQGRELKQLVELNLMDDLEEEFSKVVQEHQLKTGRKYRVYGLTEAGLLLFQDCPFTVN